MVQLRIREVYPGNCYRIDEVVTPAGLYITWDGLHATEQSAAIKIKNTIDSDYELQYSKSVDNHQGQYEWDIWS